MVNCWFGFRWFGFLGSPFERVCYLGAPLESQTTGPQTTNILWVDYPILQILFLQQPTAPPPQSKGEGDVPCIETGRKQRGHYGSSQACEKRRKFSIGWLPSLKRTNCTWKDAMLKGKSSSTPIFRCYVSLNESNQQGSEAKGEACIEFLVKNNWTLLDWNSCNSCN